MKRSLSVLLVLCMVISMLPLAVFAEDTVVTVETQTDLSLAADEWHSITWEAPSNGTITIAVSSVDPGVAFEVVGASNLSQVKASSSMTVDVTAGVEYEIRCAGYKNWDTGYAVTVSYTITFTPATGDAEVTKADYVVSDYVFSATGTHEAVPMLNSEAVVTVFSFAPQEVGTYKIAVADTVNIAYCGANWPDETVCQTLPETANHAVEWTCTAVGQSILLGIYAETDTVDVTIEKTAEYIPETIEDQVYTNKYENLVSVDESQIPVPADYNSTEECEAAKAEYQELGKTINWEMPEGMWVDEYVNVLDEKTHSAVLGTDGYYHLDSEDGPILLADMDYMGIVLSNAMFSTRPTMTISVKQSEYYTIRYDISHAVMTYEINCDDNGYYPLTDDLIFFYKEYADWQFYAEEEYGDGSNEDLWMYCCCTMVDEKVLEISAAEGFVAWTAPKNGTVYFTVSPADCAVDLCSEGGTDVYYTIENGSGEYAVTEGTTYELWTVTSDATVTCSYNAPASGEDEEPTQGTEEAPIQLIQTENTVTNTGTTYYQGNFDGMIMTVTGTGDFSVIYNSTTTAAVDGKVEMSVSSATGYPVIFAIVGDGEYSVNFTYPVGHMQNAAALTLGSNTAAIEANAQGYYYTWTASAAGELTITMPTGNWYYAVNNMTTGIYGDGQWSDSDPVMQSYTVKVAEGDVIQLIVNTYDPANTSSTPAGSITFTAEFAPYTAQIGDVQYTNVLTALAAAQSGDVVTLVADAVVDGGVVLPVGVNLNLGAYSLTADYLVGFNGSYVTGVAPTNSAPNVGGTLNVPENALILGENVPLNNNIGILPVWDINTNSYCFSQFRVNTEDALEMNVNDSTISFGFSQTVSGPISRNLLADNGGSDNGLSVILRLTWDVCDDNGNVIATADQDFVYSDYFVETVADNAAQGGKTKYTFKITGYAALGISLESNLTVTPMFKTNSGAVVCGQTYTVNAEAGTVESEYNDSNLE